MIIDVDSNAQPIMRVEVVDVNYYMDKPLPKDAIPSLPQGPCYERARSVPVVRIFGATPAGQKCCAHLHGIFPYFYMRCENDPTFDSIDELVTMLPKVAHDIESAVRTLSQANVKAPVGTTNSTAKPTSRQQNISVAKLAVVKGVPFYGYHASEVLFIKVFLYDPAMMSRIVQVVESGLVTQRTFQPYEAHIPYLLQVFADYHIEGMNYLNLCDFKFRSPLPHAQPHLDSEHQTVWLAPSNALATFTGREAPVVSSPKWNARTAVCSLELDVSCHCILNPTAATSDSQCYVPSLAPLWEEEKLRRRAAGLAATPEVAPSIQRHLHDVHDGSPHDLRRSESSPLSQSDFNDQMWASLDAILRKVQAAKDMSDHQSTASTGILPSPHDESLGHLYSYSQLDTADGDVRGAAADDEVDVENQELLALLATLERNVATVESRPPHVQHDDGDDDDDDDSMDIMASQRQLENETGEKPWWDDGLDQQEPDSDLVVESTATNDDDDNCNRIMSLHAAAESPEVFQQSTISMFPSATPLPSTPSSTRVWHFGLDPPSVQDVLAGGWPSGEDKPMVRYSCDDDVPDKPVVFAGRRVHFSKQGVEYLRNYPDGACAQPPLTSRRKVRRVRTPLRAPPTVADLRDPLPPQTPGSTSQPPGGLIGQHNVHTSNVTILSVEVHVNSREMLLPDPGVDAVVALGYVVEANEGSDSPSTVTGIIMVDQSCVDTFQLPVANQIVAVHCVPSEMALFTALDQLIHRWDPDFLVGFEVQQGSWGYLIDRATTFDPPVNLIQTLSRLPLVRMDSRNQSTNHPDGQPPKIGTVWGMKKASGIWMHGRHMLNLWRCARSELKLGRYTFECVVAHVLKRRVPVYSNQVLTRWFQAGGSVRCRALEYLVVKTSLNMSLLDGLQLITRTSEMARLFGMDFFSVLSRGSQYRVEAVNIRVTKRLNYILISPNRQQVAGQAPMECIPLVMEPLSAFYGDPVVVLDFQSLYPSMMIAYNICYSTCLGRLKNGMDDEVETALGVVSNHVVDINGLLQSGKQTTITPNGVLFCPKTQRHGVLPLVLSEILSTRIMIKQAMKAAVSICSYPPHIS
ncbi:hypothetical protein H257_12611 [Aphanomyces astaci]|uniref:DNA polymerase zeta catalytic subunit n=1 Tax=Aphanomyces astaci TaxID=112090 RepID=W4FZR9_APHAT|nr:hypothetical protein H257_12611 [Aphanomyces astaci]ETV72516.1 hypothetical protein H257_12611 [Aphanomyces astaci]|eukprot:XP_009838198.1 hypothetical protein H257_12611 [Aphanomyces astaci]